MFLGLLHFFCPCENTNKLMNVNPIHQQFDQANERCHLPGFFFMQILLKLIVENICSLWYNLLRFNFFRNLIIPKNEDFCNCNRPHFSCYLAAILSQPLLKTYYRFIKHTTACFLYGISLL